MFRGSLLLFFLAGHAALVAGEHGGNGTASPAPLLLVSFDGFRADYLQKYDFPNLQRFFFSEGVLVKEVTNVFITKTFPNHYSLVTGLYAESHGILASNMHDAATGKNFSVADDRDPFWWNQATPIWVTAQEAGLETAAAMWPGTDIAIQNRTASHFLRYDPRVTFRERVANVTGWLERDEAVRFAALYWEEPDRSGHHYGPDNTTEMGRVLKEVDDLIGLLVEQLNSSGLWGRINVILTSDHGMAQCSQDRLIRLDGCLHPENYTVVDLTPVGAIIPLGDPALVFKALSKCHPNMKAYMKKDIPDRLHYKNNERVQPIMLVADEGWTIVQHGNLSRLGDHGYDNSLPSMHPFLAARGPAFGHGLQVAGLSSVDVYPLMCRLLGLQERPNNGSLARARCLLAGEACSSLAPVLGLVVGVLLLLSTLTGLFIFLKNKVPSRSRPFSRLELQEDDDDDPLIG
ncbi:bis(5'-adenosyl)-triphosphatase enpp4 [Anguilla rostrata]|uniref:bis(5'-adenosyl)-triphosphatase enpp4 n=1 Tax=Anguilla rostrata TaxID=7938 RepID=UPI0030CCA8A5